MLEPRRLLTFREVAERRSFSRAAEALALTQPAVSQQVGALERELGAELLERGPSGLASVVPDAIAALRASDPDVVIEARETALADLAAGVLAGDLHAAILFEDAGAEPRSHPGLQ